LKQIRIFVGILALLGLLVSLSRAEQTDYPIGQVGGSELKIGLGPRAEAMGEAFVAKADDLNSTAWNPAGLSQMQGVQAGFMHDIYLQSTALEYLAYAQNVFTNAGIGANVMLLNYGKMDKIDDNANVTGDFSPTAFSAALGYGQWVFPALAVGGSVKLYHQNIDSTQTSAVAVDLGVLLKPGLDGLQLGLALQNLGSKLGDADLPRNAKAGVAYALPVMLSKTDTWNVLADVNVPFGDTKYVSGNFGTEYWFSQLLAARVGYKLKDTGELGGVNGLTAGVGGKFSLNESMSLNVDYALVTYGDLGQSHQIMLGVGFK